MSEILSIINLRFVFYLQPFLHLYNLREHVTATLTFYYIDDTFYYAVKEIFTLYLNDILDVKV